MSHLFIFINFQFGIAAFMYQTYCCLSITSLSHCLAPSSPSLTSMSSPEDCLCCGKNFKRLESHLVRSIECGSYYSSQPLDASGRPTVTNASDAFQGSVSSHLNSRSSRVVRGADDQSPSEFLNVDDDDNFVFLDDEDAHPDDDEDDYPDAGNKDNSEVSEGIEGGEGPDVSVLDLYLKLFKLRANPLGLLRFSREEEVLIELLQLLRDLHCPLKAFEIILKWAAKSNGHGHIFQSGSLPTRKKVIANLYERYNMNGLIPNEKRLYLPHTQRIVSMIYFNATEVFASLLSCPTLNQDANFF